MSGRFLVRLIISWICFENVVSNVNMINTEKGHCL